MPKLPLPLEMRKSQQHAMQVPPATDGRAKQHNQHQNKEKWELPRKAKVLTGMAFDGRHKRARKREEARNQIVEGLNVVDQLTKALLASGSSHELEVQTSRKERTISSLSNV
jgi:uncharacterized Zn finger protein